MTNPWRQSIGLLRVARAPLLLTVISNAWLIVFLTKLSPIEPAPHPQSALAKLDLGWLLLIVAGLGVGLHVYAAALNDVLDARYDRVFHPHRPVPRGQVNRTTAVLIALVSLLVALGFASMLGQASTILAIVVALGIIFYNALGKYLPAVGIVTLGLVRAGLMFTVYPALHFGWPIWLVMTHTIACTAIAYRIAGKRPQLSPTEVWQLAAGWGFWTMALVIWMRAHSEGPAVDQPYIWLGPVLPAVVFAAYSWQVVSRHSDPMRSRRRVGTAYQQLAMLWLVLFDMGWLLAAGLVVPGLATLGLFAIAAGGAWWIGAEPTSDAMPGYQLHRTRSGDA